MGRRDGPEPRGHGGRQIGGVLSTSSSVSSLVGDPGADAARRIDLR